MKLQDMSGTKWRNIWNLKSTYLELTHLPTPWSRVRLEKLTVFKLVKKFPYFIEPEGSSPHSQLPASCPSRQSARSSPYTSHFLKIHLNITLPSTPGYQVVSYPQVSPLKPWTRRSSPPYMPHAPPISVSILAPEQCWVIKLLIM